jgi:hypothetical protein
MFNKENHMLATTIIARNIIRSALRSDRSIVIDKHSYTEKTSIKDVNRRSIVFKSLNPIINKNGLNELLPINNKNELIEFINSEFIKAGYTNTVKITSKSYSPYEYIRVISYIS